MPRYAFRPRSLWQAGHPGWLLRTVERWTGAPRRTRERVLQTVGTLDRGSRAMVRGGPAPLRHARGGLLRAGARAVWQRLAGADARGRLPRLVRLYRALYRGMERDGAVWVLR